MSGISVSRARGPSSNFDPMKPKMHTEDRSNNNRIGERQYRQQILEAQISERKSWVDKNVYDLVGMRKHPPKKFVKGRRVLTVKNDKDGQFLKCKAKLGCERFPRQTKSPY